MASEIDEVPVVDGVNTPIGASLEEVAGDLGGAPGPKIVVLVTDGEETCGGDPGTAIRTLTATGFDVRVNIVGFALDDAALKAQFEDWARLGNGQYIDARDQAELTAAVAAAVQPTFTVMDSTGAVIATGQVDAEAMPLPPGTYTVEIHSARPQQFAVEILSNRATSLQLS
jgi:hypothetical protein